jgi:hypothetical protein
MEIMGAGMECSVDKTYFTALPAVVWRTAPHQFCALCHPTVFNDAMTGMRDLVKMKLVFLSELDMVNWFGRRNNKPPVSEYRKARNVVVGLTGGDGVVEIGEITTALEALTAAGAIQLEDRFDDIHQLDTAGQERLLEMLGEYLAMSRQKKQRESELWNGAYNYLQVLYGAYVLCLQRYEADPRGSVRFRARLPVVLARALRALRLQLKWTLLRYAIPENRIWTDMAGLYVFAESNAVADENVEFYPGKFVTVKQEFVNGLMMAASSHDSLRPAEQDIATRIVDHYSGDFIISLRPADRCTHWFDLTEPKVPVRNSKAPPENHVVRYFGAGAALTELEKVIAEIAYERSIPAKLMFYPELDDRLMVSALRHLEQDWAGKSQAREHERHRITSRLTVVPGFPEILRALDFAVNDSLDFTEQAAAESWVVEDMSEGGYGAVIPSIAGDWVDVGGLMAVEGESIRDWRVGIIRRVNRLDGNQQRVGVQLIGGKAALVKLARTTVSPDEALGKPLVSAVLLTTEPEIDLDVEMFAPAGTFSAMGQVEVIMGEKSIYLRPTKVIERSAHADRVALTVLSVT